jgi:hypothetical protein
MIQEMAFLFYMSIPVLTFGFGYYFFTERRRNRLFSQFEGFRREVYRINTMERFKDLEKRVMIWNDKLRLETEKPWRTEIFLLMREQKEFIKENEI